MPKPGAVGIGVDLGLPVGGLVDVLLLPFDPALWPTAHTRLDFYVWWFDDQPPIRLVAADRRYRRDDFDTWVTEHDTPAPGRAQPLVGIGGCSPLGVKVAASTVWEKQPCCARVLMRMG